MGIIRPQITLPHFPPHCSHCPHMHKTVMWAHRDASLLHARKRVLLLDQISQKLDLKCLDKCLSFNAPLCGTLVPSSKVWPPLNLRQLPNLLVLPRLSATYTVRDVFAQQWNPDAVQKQCFRKTTHSKSKIPGAYPNPFSNPTQLVLKSCGRILRNLKRNSGFLLWKVGPCLPCWFV